MVLKFNVGFVAIAVSASLKIASLIILIIIGKIRERCTSKGG